MKNPVKILLFLLLLPLLIVFGAIVLLPVLLFLLILIIFMPSVRVFHLFQTPRTAKGDRTAGKPEKAASEEVIDVECTVTESSEETGAASDSPPKQQDR